MNDREGPKVRLDYRDADELALAFAALDAAIDRHRASAGSSSDLAAAFASAAEATWWISSIDERLARPSEEPIYDDVDGALTVRGLRWARDRHSHQLPLTTPRDATPFLAPPGSNYVVYISPGVVWRPYDDFREKGHSPSTSEEAYKTHVQRRACISPLLAARDWLVLTPDNGSAGITKPKPAKAMRPGHLRLTSHRLLRELMARWGYSVADLGAVTGTPRSTISLVISGRDADIRKDRARALAAALHVDISTLFVELDVELP